MSDAETLILVLGMLVIIIISVLPFYWKFLRKKPAHGLKKPLTAYDPLQKKPVIPFDRQRVGSAAACEPKPAKPESLYDPLPPEPATQPRPEPVHAAAQKDNETLLSEIQSGFIRIVTQTRCFQDQIQLLQNIKKAIDKSHPLEGKKALIFHENAKQIDQLSDKYIILYHNLRVLMENESMIRSLDVLHSHRLREFETIRQITVLSRQLQPLLNENEDIVAPFIGYPE